MIDEYKVGRTPNPDIMCNQEVKFKLFFDTAIEQGADYIATGHYCRTKDGHLFTGLDTNKDQSYFLYRVTSKALKQTIFPLGELKKPEVRKIAIDRHLVTAVKKESMGICFVGKVGIKEFLSEFVDAVPGSIIDQNDKIIGQHEGAIFYTIGQRRGLNIGGGFPYYVTGKDMLKNEVYVTTHIDDERLWHEELKLTDLHWINEPAISNNTYQVRIRYRAPLINCHFSNTKLNLLKLNDPVKALSPGQSAVIYNGQEVLGGGIVI